MMMVRPLPKALFRDSSAIATMSGPLLRRQRPPFAPPSALTVRRHFGLRVVVDTARRCSSSTTSSVAEAASNASDSSKDRSFDSTRALLKGVVLDHAIDLRSVRPGDQIDIPYELTLTETLQDFWFAAFFDQSRIHTSRPFCRQMGLQDRVVPFSLALFLASSMSHADAAKVQVGFGNVHYLWPIFSGDTLRRTFTVSRVRNTSDGNHSVIHFLCDLINQRNRLCMRADKRMLFQFPVTESSVSLDGGHSSDGAAAATPNGELSSQDAHLFRDHLLSRATTVLAAQPSHSLSTLHPGDLILHSLHRSLTFTQSQQLASLARLTHPRHFDRRTYETNTEILIPGGLVLGSVLSASGRDLHEILHEEIRSCSYVNALHPENMVGALSYVSHVDEHLPGDLELATVTTLGVKNLIVKRDLANVGIPLELFQPGLFAKELELICKESCPALSGKIVVQVERKILRRARHRQVFLL
jgi:acyl dehydratase